MEQPQPSAELDQSLARSIAWNAASRWGGQVLRWTATIVVYRALGPANYGLFGMAIFYVELLGLICEFALETALVTIPGLTRHQIAQTNTLCVLLGVLGVAITVPMAPLLAAFFGEPELEAMVLAMSSVLLVKGFGSVPMSMMRRDLRFKRLAAYEAMEALVLSGTSVVFALLGFRYWTLVLAYVLSNVVLTGLYMTQVRWPFAWPHWRDLKRMIQFGWHVSISRVSWFWYTHADALIVGKLLGKTALGNYQTAYHLAGLPIEKITVMISRVTPTYFARVQENLADVRRFFLRLTEGISLINFALCWGLALVSDEFVRAVLGPKWLAVIPILPILAFYAAWKSVHPLFEQVLISKGEERVVGRAGLAATVVLPAAFLLSARWGTVGIAASWLVVHPLLFYFLYRQVFRTLELRFWTYLTALRPALQCSATMAAGVWAANYLVPDSVHVALRLFATTGAGALGYLGTLLLFHRQRVSSFLRVLRARQVPQQP